MSKLLKQTILILLLWMIGLPIFAQEWVLKKTISTRGETPLYITCKSSNLIYYTTFNSSKDEGVARIISITDPLGRAEVKVIDTQKFPSQRGYSGIAVTPAGALYISAEAGTPEQSFIKKFTPEGAPDINFGNRGVLQGTTNRFFGIDVIDNYLLVAVDWGTILILDGKTGKLLNTLNAPQSLFIRDIAINPNTKEIYAVAAASIYKWAGGTLDNPASYKFVPLLINKEGQPKSGEGIFFEPFYGYIYATLSLGEQQRGLQIVTPDGKFIGRIHHLDLIGDCAISPDGDLLFLTGVHNQQIYCFNRKGSAYERQDFSSRFGTQTSTVTTGLPVADSLWRTNLPDAFAEIIHSSSPYKYLAAVFYSSDNLPSQQFITSLLTDEFRRQFPQILWTKIDVKLYPGFLSSYSVFRVPTIIVFNARGEQLLRLINPASQQTITAEFASLK